MSYFINGFIMTGGTYRSFINMNSKIGNTQFGHFPPVGGLAFHKLLPYKVIVKLNIFLFFLFRILTVAHYSLCIATMSYLTQALNWVQPLNSSVASKNFKLVETFQIAISSICYKKITLFLGKNYTMPTISCQVGNGCFQFCLEFL